jgi:hypothetical protein
MMVRRRKANGRRRHGLPRYAVDVLAAGLKARRDASIEPGGIYTLAVAHDDWCSLLKGTGPCDCNPVVGTPQRVILPEIGER